MRRMPLIALIALLSAIAALLVWWLAPPRAETGGPTGGDAPTVPTASRGGPTGHGGPVVLPGTAAARAPARTDAGGARVGEARAAEDLFARKLEQDRLLLGPQRHDAMERLWAEGRKNRGDKQGIERLERLLREYPGTNRAGCASWELGHQYIRSRDHDLHRGREHARKYWEESIDRYGSSICEQNVSVSARAKLGLAAWVYRYTDPQRARKLLQEVIEQAQQEATPHDRTPPAVTARGLLENIAAKTPAGEK